MAGEPSSKLNKHRVPKPSADEDEGQDRITEEFERVWEAIYELNWHISRVENYLDILSKSFYVKFFLDLIMYGLVGRGERLLRWERNARVDGEDIDLLVETERTVYVVEVRIEPRPSDVGALLVKAELVAKHYPGKKIVPVLTGARIGGEVAELARSKGVMVASW